MIHVVDIDKCQEKLRAQVYYLQFEVLLLDGAVILPHVPLNVKIDHSIEFVPLAEKDLVFPAGTIQKVN